MTQGERFASIGERQRDRAKWTRRVVIGGLVTITLLGWALRYCMREKEREARERPAFDYAAYERDREARAGEMPVLERRTQEGISIEVPKGSTLHEDSSRVWGRLSSNWLRGFMDPFSSGVFVEWREGELATARLPLPGDPVQSLFANNGGSPNVVVEEQSRQIEITLGKRVHGIATYVQCDNRIVIILVWHRDVAPLAKQVVASFRCGT